MVAPGYGYGIVAMALWLWRPLAMAGHNRLLRPGTTSFPTFWSPMYCCTVYSCWLL